MPSNGPVYSVGRYWGKSISWNFGKSKEKGTPQFSITFDIVGAINPSEPEGQLLNAPSGQRTVFWYLTEGTMPYVLEDLERLGFNKPSLRFLNPDVDGAFDFSGIEIELYCGHEPYNNVLKEKWRLSNPRVGIVAEPLESNEVRKLDALFGKGLKQLASKAAATPVAPVETAAQIVMDPEATVVVESETAVVSVRVDDVPF